MFLVKTTFKKLRLIGIKQFGINEEPDNFSQTNVDFVLPPLNQIFIAARILIFLSICLKISQKMQKIAKIRLDTFQNPQY